MAKVSYSSGAQVCATSFGCPLPGQPCSLGDVVEEPVLCEERFSAQPPALLSLGSLRKAWGSAAKGTSFRLSSLPN